MPKDIRHSEDTWIPTMCWGCVEGPDVIKVRRLNGVAVNIEGNADLPNYDKLTKNQGRICGKPYAFIHKLYNPHRIKAPLRRTNPQKGPGIDPKWVEISWDEAMDTISAKLRDIRARNTRLLASSTRGPMWRSLMGTLSPFFSAFGPVQELGGGSSLRCDQAEHIFANVFHSGFQCEPDMDYCKYLLIVGNNTSVSGGAPENVQVADARLRGIKVVVVDPVFSLTAAKADEWIPIRPGTDTAFFLGLIHVVMHELKTYDEEFLKGMTNSPYLVDPKGYFARDAAGKVLVWDAGEHRPRTHDDPAVKDVAITGVYTINGVECKPAFQVLKDHMAQYSAEWASAVTEIPAETIRRIAREYVENACIGSTIKIGGHVLPYRPVDLKMGRHLSGGCRSYSCLLADHILAMLVGSLEVPGGHCGGRARRLLLPTGLPSPEDFNIGVRPGPDGMPKADTFDFVWPPVSLDGTETLLPYCRIWGRTQGLAFRHMVDPPKNFPLPPVPELFIRYRSSPLTTVGEPELVSQALLKVPFIVSIAYVQDEFTELADIVLPDHTEFERYELMSWVRAALAKKFSGVILRQPVVEPLHNTMDLADIFTELASRAGFLAEYNEKVNSIFGLTGDWKLDPATKYRWADIVDRQCKSYTGGEKDLNWFKQHGAIFKEVPVEDQYDVHFEMKRMGLRYQLPYVEHVKKTGERLARDLAGVGVDWWPTDEYTPLPVYKQSACEQSPAEYDMYVTTARSPQFGFGSDVEIPMFAEIAEYIPGQQDILMNRKTALSRGIRDGDEIWVESEVGKVKRKVKLTELIRPDTILITGQFGQWSTPFARDTGRVSMTPLAPIRHSWTDPVVGTMQGGLIKAKVYKD
ncbi:MAG: molybdopterin-dependent oxidoreductase [Chloroflexi bacterium]|nr:molybdopterin-dependent oxidoreductase [Chloroflexota bacterium]